jgi:hypothetical protein
MEQINVGDTVILYRTKEGKGNYNYFTGVNFETKVLITRVTHVHDNGLFSGQIIFKKGVGKMKKGETNDRFDCECWRKISD